ncbi:MAG: dihydroorotate dehydrogenase [Bacteroidales bacterium]|nr:dihydroorotate dehydrogenase [Bacteroidales bacterium]MDD4684923.1 dihydroorotate dehydrogenase [Bacteroidales bacterium]
MNNADKRLEVTIKDMVLRNPVMTASGTFGYGYDFEDFMSLESLGGIVVKATTGGNREGNAYPRMAETSSGMLNAVGLQNKGVDYFCNTLYNKIKDINTNMIVNVSGSSVEEYVEVAEKINELKNIPGIELNISCPNVKQGGMAFGTDPKMAAEVVKAVRKVYNKTLIVKLSPNVTSIVEIAKSAEGEGADSLSLINTLLGMAVDTEKRKPLLSTVTGGLSGPAIKPVALRCVWQVAKQTKLPLIGIGGIMNARDAIEFILVGATAIEVGTANFINPAISQEIVYGISQYLDRHNIKNIADIRGII